MDIKTIALVSAAAILSSVFTFFIDTSFLGEANENAFDLVTENESIQSRLIELERQLNSKSTSPRRFEANQLPQTRTMNTTKQLPKAVVAEPITSSHEEIQGDEEKSIGVDQGKQIAATIATLNDPNTSVDTKQILWKKLAATGFVDQVIAALSDSSAEDPTDPDIATNLGSAYVTKLRGENVTSLERRELTQEAMVQFDRALKLDGEHWEARFSKSMMQVFAPAALGLQVRAESNLGLLLEQQRTRPQQPEHAHTYFFLSNLYANQGQGSKSQALRQEASSLFPNDKRFR